MGSAAKNLALPAVLEALAGVFMILRAQKFEFRHDEDGTGAALVGIGAIVFAQSMMVFSANPRRVPKGALIAFKAVLSLCAVYAVVTTATERKRAWAEWFVFLAYSISSVPVCFMIYAAGLHGKTEEKRTLGQISASERAALR
ncbi:unnamed protein product [Durusdinium trenchii]|uniref:Uncharacterized protein n=2 Tax=Durusdinium trenchii TaxID=1381693 RepID=A0ABP0LXK4_9DINO